jgi:thioesterase domain-containing protein/acyl carrier protein
MIPAVVVYVDALPLTPNGKVDRQALAAQEPNHTKSSVEFVAPRTPLEHELADIWREVLKVERVGIHENFFELGGYSLLAARVVWALEKRLSRPIPLASLFAAPTIEQLASLLSTDSPAPDDRLEARLVKIWEAEFATGPLDVNSNFFDLGGNWLRSFRLLLRVEQEFGKRLPMAALYEAPTPGQLVKWLRYVDVYPHSSTLLPYRTTGAQPPFFGVGVPRQLIHYLGPDRPVYSFPPYGFDGRKGPETVEEIAAQYLSEIRAIQAQGPYWLGGYSLEGMVAFEMAQQLQSQGQTVAGLFLFEPTPPYYGRQSRPTRRSASSDRPLTRNIRFVLSHHITRLKHLPPRAQLTRLWNGVSGRLQNRLEPVLEALKLLLCRGYLAAGYTIPPTLREFYGRVSRYPVARRYQPKPYAGRVFLFKIAERDVPAQEDWEHFITGETKIYHISARHQDLFKDRYFHTWGPQLVDVFNRSASEGAKIESREAKDKNH